MSAGEPTPTIAELISFIRACEDEIGTEGYSRPRFRAILAILEAGAAMSKEPLTLVPREYGDQLSAPAQDTTLAICLAFWIAGQQIPGDADATRALRAKLLADFCAEVRQRVPRYAEILGTTP